MSILIRFSPKRLTLPLNSIINSSRHLSHDQSSLTTKNQLPQHYDIIIAGGGLVGTALACGIAKNKVLSEKKVLLLEGAPPFKGFAGGQYGNRVSAINNGSVELFKSIGAWDKISSTRYKPVKQMQVWDGSSDALITFNHDNFSENVACIIENDLMLDAIYTQLETAQNVTILNKSMVGDVKLRMDGNPKNVVSLKNGDSMSCDLLIGADGANSIVRKQMGVDVFSLNYERMGLVATLELVDPGDNSVAWQRFIPTGPIAFLPLNDTMSSLVWSTTPSEAKRLASMEPNEFVDAVNEAFWKDYPKSNVVTNALEALNSIMGRDTLSNRQYPPKVKSVVDKSRACFPLGFLHASSYVSTGVALIGDAAHRIHPLAGQGVNLGFSDVTNLVKVLSDAVYAGAEIGDKHHLVQYEQNSLIKNVPLMIGVHGLQRLYSTTFSPVVLLRSLGLQLTQNIPGIKDIFLKRAIA
ncbi:ubiquinone biosynthesis monooxygenase COQ6, mitochondrial [Episyrphus balteatus]|uniref:ubiquinone biosynthesis monooxygenase COQ6, mitochondrial n=1 Tax=Episyrphus balteatus TaxID=286459 RepID=UPI002484E61F|nr:ubiquinone biosynthesis monooxygenase COQ6, mitochondrial [Episyrphus balteatus]